MALFCHRAACCFQRSSCSRGEAATAGVVVHRAVAPVRCLSIQSRASLSQSLPISRRHSSAATYLAPPKPVSRASVKVNANWGAPVDFTPAKVLSNHTSAPGMHELKVDIGSLASGYTNPGQYIQLKVGDSKAGFFAIASPPKPGDAAGGVVSLLIKTAPDSTAELLCGATEGMEVSTSPVQGKGFAIDRLPSGEGATVLLFATGSGISPIRSVIESGVLAGKSSVLFYGTRTEEATAFTDLIPTWEASGIKLVQVFSGKGEGYIQDALAKRALELLTSPSNTCALLCGQKGMVTAVTETLTAAGVPAEAILLNF